MGRMIPPCCTRQTLREFRGEGGAVPGEKTERKIWRRGWDSNPRMEVLQTSPLGLLGTAPCGNAVYRKRKDSVSVRRRNIVEAHDRVGFSLRPSSLVPTPQEPGLSG